MSLSTFRNSPLGPSPIEGIYSSFDSIHAYIKNLAVANGYNVIKRDSQPPGPHPRVVTFACNKSRSSGNQQDPNLHDSKRRKVQGSKRVNCPFKVKARRYEEGQWQLELVCGDHNHGPHLAPTADPANRLAAQPPEVLREIDKLRKGGNSPADILSTLRVDRPDISLVPRDIYNLNAKQRLDDLAGKTPIQWLMDKLQEEGFRPRFNKHPTTNRLERLFFLHPKALELYQQNPHILLLDATYKTNKFNMPLLNICAVTGNNLVIQVGLVFLSGEKKADYKWAMEQFNEVMAKMEIEEPYAIVTDRELALMEVLDKLFQHSYHLLCRWHVNMNVLAKCKQHFPGPIKSNNGVYSRHPDFKAFIQDWNSLLLSTTEESYDKQLKEFREKHPKAATFYVESTWLIFKEKLVRFWVDQHLHIGYLVTSPIEGCHAGLKRYLRRSTAGLDGVFTKLQHFWTNQHAKIRDLTAQQFHSLRYNHRIPLFYGVINYVHGFALNKILTEVSKLPANNTPPPYGCSCTITQSHGLPCFHKIWERQQNGGTLLLEDIHAHWLVHKPAQNGFVQFSPLPDSLILEPLRIKGKGRPKGALGSVSREPQWSTRRYPSTFESPSSSAPSALCSNREQLTSLYIVPGLPQQLPNQQLPHRPYPLSKIHENGLTTTELGLVRMKEIGDIYEPGTQRERGYMRSISSIWNTDFMGSDADLSGVLMADLESEDRASSVSSASFMTSGGDSDGYGDGDSKEGRYPEIILGYEIDTQDGEHETETQWERWQNRVN